MTEYSISVVSSDSSFVDEKNIVIPADIQLLTNVQLRDRLISLKEQPGPINEFTRTAYLVYLTKLEMRGFSTTTDEHFKGLFMCN